MATYNLTTNQKHILKIIVVNIRAGIIEEPFMPIGIGGGDFHINGIEEPFRNLIGDLHVLESEGLVSLNPYNKSKIYTICQLGYDAVDNNFEKPAEPEKGVVNVAVNNSPGASIQAILGNNLTDIKQTVNDPQLFSAKIDELTNELVEAIKTELSADKLMAYIDQVKYLKSEIQSEKPSSSVLQKAIQTLAFLGDIEGNIALVTRAWPYILPILTYVSQKLIELALLPGAR